MEFPSLTLKSLTARSLLLPMKRPVVARIATISSWPVILIDLETEEIIKKAFHIATTGRPGPVVIDIPKNVSDPSYTCLLYTSPSPRDATLSRMASSA